MSSHQRYPSDVHSRAPTYHTQYTPPANDYYDQDSSSSAQQLPRRTTGDSMAPFAQRYQDEPQGGESHEGHLPGASSRIAAGSAGRIDTTGLGREKSISAASRFSPNTPGAKTDFKTWRRDHLTPTLWTRGRGLNCCLRFCCCTLFIAVFMIISIILTLAIYVRPPDITFNNVTLDTASGSAVLAQASGLTINLKIDITVANPNFFSASFQSIQAKALYPIAGQPDTPIGGGTSNNVVFKTETVETIGFPFAIVYTKAIDPSQLIITDILTKCGFLGGAKQDLSINYDLILKIRIIVFTIAPQFSGNARFACPITQDEASILAAGLGISLTGGGGS